ncbi:hypothetical protein ACFQ9V_01030 [Leifsonia sp. NPDC056665]|uniref:hypothetical protein n=1 Tax=Leifsonia sp. NPDC056665 TaxID=3345901 RepID=UPI00369914F8
MPTLVRVTFTPKRTKKGQFHVHLSDERVWDIGTVVVTMEGNICWAQNVWRPGGIAPYSPQSRMRTATWQEHQRQTEEIMELRGLLRRAQAAGIYRSLIAVTVSGTRPSGMVNRDDERYGIWYDGTGIRHGRGPHDTSYSEHLTTAAANAIVEAANRPRRSR